MSTRKRDPHRFYVVQALWPDSKHWLTMDIGSCFYDSAREQRKEYALNHTDIGLTPPKLRIIKFVPSTDTQQST